MPMLEEMNPYVYYASLIRVVDGDTVDLEIDLGLKIFTRQRIRLFGIDTPEIHGVKKDSEEFIKGAAAKDRVVELLFGKKLLVETTKDKTGKYGRYLARVWAEDTCINDLLVKEGFAQEY